MIRNLKVGAIAAGLIGLASSAYALPITPGLTITNGSMTFSNFTCATTGATLITCAQIDVIGNTSPGGPGIRISGGFNAFNGPTSEDVVITYNAVDGGSNLIRDIDMLCNCVALPANMGLASITETVTDLELTEPGVLAQITVLNPPPASNLFATANLTPPEDGIHVVKDITFVTTGPSPAIATISVIDQNFSQKVPEPASLALLAWGLIGLGWFGRRRGNRA